MGFLGSTPGITLSEPALPVRLGACRIITGASVLPRVTLPCSFLPDRSPPSALRGPGGLLPADIPSRRQSKMRKRSRRVVEGGDELLGHTHLSGRTMHRIGTSMEIQSVCKGGELY